jgi:hypothetical protein
MTNRTPPTIDDRDDFMVDDVSDDVAEAMRQLREAPDTNDGTVSDGAGITPHTTEPEDTGTEETEDTGTEETEEQRADRERDNRGRFAPKAAKGETEKSATDPAAPVGPPPSWGVKAKAAWVNVPADVQAEIQKREGEVQQGLAALRDYRDLKPYADTARTKGVTLKTALDHYAGLDRLCSQDLGGGLAHIAAGFGKTKEQIGALFADLAQRYGASVPNGGNAPAPADSEANDLQELLAPVLKPILDQIGELRQNTTTRVEADRNAQVQTLASAIQTFAANPEHTYYANVEGDIIRLFEGRLVPLTGNHAADLKAAYDMAVRMNPEIQDALIEQRVNERAAAKRKADQDKANTAKAASRSLGGSKVPGVMYAPVTNGDGRATDDVEADVRAAYRAHVS